MSKEDFVFEWCFFLLAKVSRDTREASFLPSLHHAGPRDSQALGSRTGLARGVSLDLCSGGLEAFGRV